MTALDTDTDTAAAAAAAAAPTLTPPAAPSLFVLSTTDPDGAVRFYRAVLGWDLRPADRLAASPTGQTLLVREGQVGWLPFLAVDDVAAVVARTLAAGGRAVFPLPGDADRRTGSLFDPNDTRVGIYLPDAGDDAAPPVRLGGGDIVWLEQKTGDQLGAGEFLRQVFGFQAVGKTGPGVVQLLTGNAGRRYAGIMAFDDRYDADQAPFWLLYASVTSVEQTLAAAVENGGSVWFPPTPTPMGPIAYFRDPSGNPLAVVEVSDQAAAGLLGA